MQVPEPENRTVSPAPAARRANATIDPRRHDAVLFDLDGVVADTTDVEFVSWQGVLEEFLKERTAAGREAPPQFREADYREFFDGVADRDGVTAFLTSRGVAIPMGTPADEVLDTVHGLANRRERRLSERLKAGVPVFETTVALVGAVSRAGMRTAVYSTGRHSAQVLEAAGLDDLFPVHVDLTTADGRHLPGAGVVNVLSVAAEMIEAAPERTVVLAGSAAGIESAHAAGFALVVGIDRTGGSEDLVRAGADMMATDVADVHLRDGDALRSCLPNALAAQSDLISALRGRQPFVCLDFDGTLSRVVADPARAQLVEGAAEALAALAAQCPVAILSGRDLDDIRRRVGVPGIWYAGSHGFEMVSPAGDISAHSAADAAAPQLAAAAQALRRALQGIPGTHVDVNRYRLVVHHRSASPAQVGEVVAATRHVARTCGLRAVAGRHAVELTPDLDWDNGLAMDAIRRDLPEVDRLVSVYVGDDLADEDAFDRTRLTGITVVVRHAQGGNRPTAAEFALDSPIEVCDLLRLLADAQATGRASDAAWFFSYDGYDPPEEKLREALCTVGNGYLATRGAAPESTAGTLHYPATYLAGVYNRLDDVVSGRTVGHESLVNVPNWLPLTLRIDGGAWFDVDTATLLDYRQTLDLRSAMLIRELTFRDDAGHTTSLTQRRFVALHTPHVAALETTIRALNWSGTLEVCSSLDGDVRNGGVARYQQLADTHLTELERRAVSGDTVSMTAHTTQSQITVALAARTTVWHDDAPAAATYRYVETEHTVGHRISTELTVGHTVTVEKLVSIVSGRDAAITQPAEAAERHLLRQGRFTTVLDAHRLRWSHLWQRMAIDFDDHEAELRVLRLHTLHLLQTVSHLDDDIDAGVPARGLHGEAYRGHIFWDELFVFAVLNLRLPDVTRSLLRYRHRRLPEARRAAALAGYEGAMFPWQSGSDGREESPQLHLNPRSGRWNPDPSHRAQHVGLAVAYNVWQFYQVTGDLDALIEHGAETLAEIARFWVSRTTYDPGSDRFSINGVIGPDEFHNGYPDRPYEGVDDNAYTNVMAAWVILRAREALHLLPLPDRMDLLERLGLSGTELDHWDHVSRRLFVPFHEGRISQFEGFEALEELDWDAYRARYVNVERLDRILEAEGDDVNRYKVSKQADVLMLLYLLSSDELCELLERLDYRLDPNRIPDMVDYYLARTSHGSTLSAVVNTWVLARAHRDRAVEFFRQVLDSDVADIQGGTTAEGVHLAAMAGSIDLVQRCFTGLEMRADRLVLSPYWPDPLGPLAIPITYRGHHLRISVSGKGAEISSAPRAVPPVTVECRGRVAHLSAGDTVRFRYQTEHG